MRSCRWGNGVFNQTSSPQVRPHGQSFATPLLQDFKEKKLCKYHQIHHVCPTCWNPKKREFRILLSFQGKCGQGGALECNWLRSIDILGIRNQSQCSLALQVTQCQIQIHHDPPSFPSFVEVSGVHSQLHGLWWFFWGLRPTWWRWMHQVRSELGLREELHEKDHQQSQCITALRSVPGQGKDMHCHCHRDVAGLLGKKRLWSKRTLYCFLNCFLLT